MIEMNQKFDNLVVVYTTQTRHYSDKLKLLCHELRQLNTETESDIIFKML